MGKSKEKDGKKLKRRLGVFSVFSICTGAAFSSGFFLLPGMAADISGPSLPLAYLAAGILMFPAILSMSELSAAMPRSGGPYFFVTRSFGPLLGMIGALGKFLQLLLKGAFSFVGVGIYLSVLFDVPTQLLAIVLVVLFTLLNLLGVRQTATTEKVLVIILLISLSYFLVSGITEVFSGSIDFQEQFLPVFPMGIEGFFSAIALVFISFGGVAQVTSVAEEVKNPSHSFPTGMLWSLGVSTFLYLFGTFIMIALIPSDILQGDKTPVVTAAERINQLPLPVTLIVIAALAAFTSTGNAAILSASRYPLALARDKLIWEKFGEVSKKGIPRTAVILSGAISVGIILLLNVREIAKTASAFLLFVFLSMCLAVIIFRASKKKDYQPAFKSPLYPWMQIGGSLVYIWLIWESGLKAMGFIAFVILAGSLWYSFGLKEKPHFSAAIYSWFTKLAEKEKTRAKTNSIPLYFEGSNLSSTIGDADFIDLEEEESFEEVTNKAAEILRHRLGGKREKIKDVVQEEVKHWKSPSRMKISVAPILLNGIEQPHMVIIRGKIKIQEEEGNEIHGFIVLADDNHSSNRLLQLSGQLETELQHADFPEKWEQAEGAAEVKESLINNIRSISVFIDESGPTAEFIDAEIKDIDLPEQAVIGAIYRDGSLIPSKDDTRLQPGDEIILIAHGKNIEKLFDKFEIDRSS